MKKLIFLTLLFFGLPQAYATTPVQQHKLDNGLNILLMEAHHVPMVAMKLTMPAGSRFDVEGKGGECFFIGNYVDGSHREA